MSVRTSRTKYLRFWFWFDSTFALGDWALIAIRSLASSGGGGERSARLARMAKMVKLLSAMKVVRSAKLSKHLAEFVDSNASDRQRPHGDTSHMPGVLSQMVRHAGP